MTHVRSCDAIFLLIFVSFVVNPCDEFFNRSANKATCSCASVQQCGLAGTQQTTCPCCRGGGLLGSPALGWHSELSAALRQPQKFLTVGVTLLLFCTALMTSVLKTCHCRTRLQMATLECKCAPLGSADRMCTTTRRSFALTTCAFPNIQDELVGRTDLCRINVQPVCLALVLANTGWLTHWQSNCLLNS